MASNGQVWNFPYYLFIHYNWSDILSSKIFIHWRFFTISGQKRQWGAAPSCLNQHNAATDLVAGVSQSQLSIASISQSELSIGAGVRFSSWSDVTNVICKMIPLINVKKMVL